MSNKNKRTRNFGCVIYPESAPENWLELLAEHKVPALVSPLHDRDVDPQEQQKKPHFHVVIMFEGPKTIEQAKEIFDPIGGVGCEVIKSIRGYARYLCHKDNPEKYQYDEEKVIQLYGADYKEICELRSDKYKVIEEILEFVDNEDICSYYDLLRYARVNEPSWFRSLLDNSTFVVKEYIKSRYWVKKEKSVKEMELQLKRMDNLIRKKKIEAQMNGSDEPMDRSKGLEDIFGPHPEDI